MQASYDVTWHSWMYLTLQWKEFHGNLSLTVWRISRDPWRMAGVFITLSLQAVGLRKLKPVWWHLDITQCFPSLNHNVSWQLLWKGAFPCGGGCSFALLEWSQDHVQVGWLCVGALCCRYWGWQGVWSLTSLRAILGQFSKVLLESISRGGTAAVYMTMGLSHSEHSMVRTSLNHCCIWGHLPTDGSGACS